MKDVVSERALETIERECRKFPDMETGGILVGYRDKKQVVITNATGPGPNVGHSAYHFVKDGPYLQRVMNLLFQYYQVNYVGMWHKHPEAMPYPSSGDLASAQDEIGDDAVGLEELIAPICVMESGRVQVHPYVITSSGYARIDWKPMPHDDLPSKRSAATQWYATATGQGRLAQEMSRFEELGVTVEVRKGADGTYRFRAPLEPKCSPLLVMVTYNSYPVTAPEGALYDERTREYEPVIGASER